MDKKQAVQLIVFGFIVYTIWLLNNAEMLADEMFNTNMLQGLVIYIIANPAYILLITAVMWTHKDRLMKSFLAGVSLTIALDIISIPRLPSRVPAVNGVLDFGQLALDNVLLVNSDFIIAKAVVGAGIPYGTFWYVYYAVVPIALMLLTLKLLGYDGFLKRLQGKNG